MARRFPEWIVTESSRFAETIRADTLDRPVPGCPDWTLVELVGHLGRVQRFWAADVRAGGELPAGVDDPDTPFEGAGRTAGELRAWFDASTSALVEALETTAWDTPAWTWWNDDRTVGAIARHQVQEAAVHRWDAESAVGDASPLPTELADDGVDEFLWLSRQLRGAVPLDAHATDTGHTYNAGADAAVVVRATASDLVLLFYRRIGADSPRVEVDGDRAVLGAWLRPVA